MTAEIRQKLEFLSKSPLEIAEKPNVRLSIVALLHAIDGFTIAMIDSETKQTPK